MCATLFLSVKLLLEHRPSSLERRGSNLTRVAWIYVAKEIENEQGGGYDWMPSEAGNIGTGATRLIFLRKPQDTELACRCLTGSLETRHNKGACDTTFNSGLQ